jgi:hypothetical protein
MRAVYANAISASELSYAMPTTGGNRGRSRDIGGKLPVVCARLLPVVTGGAGTNVPPAGGATVWADQGIAAIVRFPTYAHLLHVWWLKGCMSQLPVHVTIALRTLPTSRVRVTQIRTGRSSPSGVSPLTDG